MTLQKPSVILLQHNENKIAEVYQPIRKTLKASTEVGVPQMLSARDGRVLL